MNTVDSILAVLEQWSAGKNPIDPAAWVDAGLKLTALLGNETDKLHDLEHDRAVKRATMLLQGDTVAKARVVAESFPEYLKMRKQKSKIEHVLEIIRLAKLRSRMSMEEYRAN